MPKTISEVEHPCPVVSAEGIMVFVQVGDIRHFRSETPVFTFRDVGYLAGQLQLTKISAECGLLLVGDILPMEYEHAEFCHTFVNYTHVFRAQWLPQVHITDLSYENWVNLLDLRRHLPHSVGTFHYIMP